MATESASVSADDLPQLLDDGDRWSEPVVGTGVHIYRWGTHEFRARIQAFESGRGNVQVAAPRSPPPSAVEIVVDGLSGSAADAAVAAVLADEWGIDIQEVAADA